MRSHYLLVAGFLACLVLFPAVFCTSAEPEGGQEKELFPNADTGGKDAVILELLEDDNEVFAHLMIVEGKLTTISGEPKGSSVLGIELERISLRGDSARLGFYRLNSLNDRDVDPDRRIEHVDLKQGKVITLPDKTARVVGVSKFKIKLHSIRLVSR